MRSYYSARVRLRAAATVAGTGLITLALLVGMPWVLWEAAGMPWPEQVSSWRDLIERITEPVSDPLMIELLALFGWACWGAFVCSVVREIFWYAAHLPQLVRDRAVHDEHVAALSVRGSLAALCIGTLVLAVLGLWRPHAADAQQPAGIGELRPPVTVTAPLHLASSLTTMSLAEAPQSAVDQTPVTPPAEAVSEQRHVEYMVVEGNTLWDIATAHMGDALKWPRIYKLNKDRIQPDGGRLTDPDLIRPGWRLTIPVSVAGEATPPPAPPAVPEQVVPVTPETPADGGDHDQHPAHHDAEKNTPAQGHGEAQRDTERGPVTVSVGEASLIGITTATGLLAALRYVRVHRSRSRRPDVDDPEPALSPVIERATWAAREAALPRRPAEPDALFTRRTPPQQPRPAGVVTIGRAGDEEIALDALAVEGGCDWRGPGAAAAARALLCGILTAAERQRPSPPHVRAVMPRELADHLLPGLPSQFTALTLAADTAHIVRLAEEHLIAHARHRQQTQEPDADPVGARHDDDHEAEQIADPGVLLLLATPGPAHAGQFEALTMRTAPGSLLVLTLGAPLPGAAQWHIPADGIVTPPGTRSFPAPRTSRTDELHLFQLTAEAARDVVELVLGAHGQRPYSRVIPAKRAETTAPTPDEPSETEEENEAEPVASAPLSNFANLALSRGGVSEA